MSPIKKLNILLIGLVILTAAFAFSEEKKALPETLALMNLLNDRTNGNNADYNKILSPAQSLDVGQNRSTRIQTVNNKLIAEFDQVLQAFNSASEANKPTAVRQSIQNIEPDLLKNNGAFITFTDSNPSAAVSRIFLMIPKNASTSADQVFKTLSSYKRSAKPSDFVYEYENPFNLTSGTMRAYQGTETSWMGPEAAQPFDFGKNYVLKKCRQLLGWRCVTSLYRADQLSSTLNTKILFVSTYDLSQNPDHSDFSKDKRSINQITGSTAVYVVKESTNWILLYGADAQWNNDKLSFKGAIQNEFQKDFDRLKQRFSDDLRLTLGQLQ